MKSKIVWFVAGLLSGFIIVGIIFVLTENTYIKIMDSPYRYYYDYKEIIFPSNNPSLIYHGKILVPLSYYSETIGKKVVVNDITHRIDIKSSWFDFSSDEKQTRELKKEDFNFLVKGMAYKEIYLEVGPPAANMGFGLPILVYTFGDGNTITLGFGNDGLSSAVIQYHDGSREGVIK